MRTHTVVRRPKALLGLAAALAVFAASPAFAQEDPTGSWSTRPDASKTFAQGGAASDGTYLYVVGGLQESTFDQLFRFDPASNQWTELAPLPYEVFDNAVVHHNGSLYCLGGFRLDTSAVSGQILVYDIAGGAWSASPSALSTPRLQHGAAVLGDRIVVAGGLDSGFNVIGSCEIFDPADGSVVATAALPVAANHLTMAAVSGRLFAMGGFDEFGAITDANFEFVAGNGSNADAWAVRAYLQDGAGVSMGRYALRAFPLQGRVYVTGGSNANFEIERSTLEYEPSSYYCARR
jgi:N-acetylneuraminic acid mutarotase